MDSVAVVRFTKKMSLRNKIRDLISLKLSVRRTDLLDEVRQIVSGGLNDLKKDDFFYRYQDNRCISRIRSILPVLLDIELAAGGDLQNIESYGSSRTVIRPYNGWKGFAVSIRFGDFECVIWPVEISEENVVWKLIEKSWSEEEWGENCDLNSPINKPSVFPDAEDVIVYVIERATDEIAEDLANSNSEFDQIAKNASGSIPRQLKLDFK